MPVFVSYSCFEDDPQGSLQFSINLLEQLQLLPNVETIGVGSASTSAKVESLCTEVHGKVDRKTMAKLLRSADISIDYSVVQGFGMLGLEAMSSGVATVLTQTGGIREYANEDNALLVPIGNESAMFQAVAELIQNAELRDKLKQNGRKTALLRDWDIVAKDYFDYFQTLLTQESQISKENHQAMNRYLLNKLAERHQTIEVLLQSTEILNQELLSVAPAELGFQILKDELDETQMTRLWESEEGHTFVNLYEHARKAVNRLEDRLSVLRERLRPGSEKQEPLLLEKVIDSVNAINE